MATGNLYLDVSGLSRNTLFDSAKNDDSANLFGGNWSLTPRLHLVGFSKSSATVPSSLKLGLGDNGGQLFTPLTGTALTNALTTAPSWITRYSSSLITNDYYFVNAAMDGTQYSSEWIVLLTSSSGNTIAHYYDHDGNHFTFLDDGQYVDYYQTLHQQYQAAKLGFSEGAQAAPASRTTPRIEISYVVSGAANDGRITQIKDAYGRISSYRWDLALTSGGDGNSNTLDQVNYLLASATDHESYAQRLTLSYSSSLLTRVTMTTRNAANAVISRYVEFAYNTTSVPGKTLVTEIRRQILGGDPNTNKIVYVYSYDGDGRVSRVTERNTSATGTQRVEPTSYYYDNDSSFGAGGTFVDVYQGVSGTRKAATYLYDPAGRLRRRQVASSNSNPSEILTWGYAYYPNGSTAQVLYPSGMTEHYAYDAKGNLTRVTTYETPVLNASAEDNVISISVVADRTSMWGTETLDLAANIRNDIAGQGVTWSASAGTIVNTVSGSSLYATFTPSNTTAAVTITATSKTDPSKVVAH